MNKKFLAILGMSAILITGCEYSDDKQLEDTKIKEDKTEIEYQVKDDENIKNEESEILCEESEIDNLIQENVVIEDDELLEYAEWLDDENKVYRVAIQRAEEVEGEYSHVRDYFFINDVDITYFTVDYPSKSDIDADRYVYDACGFEAEYVDISFDGKKDIVISLGNQGANGTRVYCAYIYNEGEYVYNKSFEQIPNFEIDSKSMLIKGSYSSGADEHVEVEYQYREGEFVKLSEERMLN